MYIRHIAYIIVYAVIVSVFFLSVYIHRVSSDSMSPTVRRGDIVFSEAFSTYFSLLDRSDLVIFVDPRDPNHPLALKRIVGLPFEKLSIELDKLSITNMRGLAETFEPGSEIGRGGNGEDMSIQLSQDDYFLMGDNRRNSYDSRDFGTIQPHEMVGKVWFVIRSDTWPHSMLTDK